MPIEPNCPNCGRWMDDNDMTEDMVTIRPGAHCIGPFGDHFKEAGRQKGYKIAAKTRHLAIVVMGDSLTCAVSLKDLIPAKTEAEVKKEELTREAKKLEEQLQNVKNMIAKL